MMIALARAGVSLSSTIPTFSGACTVADVIMEHPQLPDTLISLVFEQKVVRDSDSKDIISLERLESGAGALVAPGF